MGARTFGQERALSLGEDLRSQVQVIGGVGGDDVGNVDISDGASHYSASYI